MKDYPGGTWIIMQGTCQRTNVELVSYGYKYNTKKVLTFVATVGAGSSRRGNQPYKAGYNDTYGNVCYRDVGRPQILCTYFNHSNVVDIHNQMRQHNLALEESWVTANGYFRLFTTFVGFTVTDLFLLKEKRAGNKDDLRENRERIVDFSSDVSESLLDMATTLQREDGGFSDEDSNGVSEAIVTIESGETCVSSVTDEFHHAHTEIYLCQAVQPLRPNGRRLPTQARCMWCARVEKIVRKTRLKCKQCDVGFCKKETGRKCWDRHVANDGPPRKGCEERPHKKRRTTL